MFQTTSYKNPFHTWQNSENMKTSLCVVLSPARASPLDYFQRLLVSHTLIHTHVFCYHEADISLVEQNVSTTIRQIAQLWICEFRICGITLSPSCCVFSSRQWCTSPLLSGMISSLFYRNTKQRLLWKTVENAPNESHYKDAVNFEQQQSALFFPCVAEVNVTPWAAAGCWLNLIWWIFALYVYKCCLFSLGLNKRISYKRRCFKIILTNYQRVVYRHVWNEELQGFTITPHSVLNACKQQTQNVTFQHSDLKVFQYICKVKQQLEITNYCAS